MNMFSSEETAFIAAERLVEESEAIFGFESCRVEVPGFPLLTKVAYIHAEGKEREWVSTHTKSANKSTNVGMKQLNDTMKGVASFLQGMPSASQGDDAMKNEKRCGLVYF